MTKSADARAGMGWEKLWKRSVFLRHYPLRSTKSIEIVSDISVVHQAERQKEKLFSSSRGVPGGLSDALFAKGGLGLRRRERDTLR